MKAALNTQDLGIWVRSERKAQGRSQAWIAAQVGCRRQTIVDLEAGRNVDHLIVVKVKAGNRNIRFRGIWLFLDRMWAPTVIELLPLHIAADPSRHSQKSLHHRFLELGWRGIRIVAKK